MNAALLLEHYARIADAPNAIARLRRLVLDLAVRGKLVEQDAADEPATELLKRIAAENLEAAVRGLDKALRTKREDLPFAPPKHWEWAKLVAFSEASYGFAFASSRFNSDKVGMPLIRIRDISSTDTEAYFDGEYDPWYVVKTGDYLVGMDGDFNLRRWRGGAALLNQRVLRLNGWRCGIEPEFVRLPLQMTLDHLHGGTSQTTVKHLSAKQVNGIEIPLPPLAEQHRIVAKVVELMALCDQLEAARADREAARDTFTLSTLAKLNTPDPETFGQDAHFALANLAPLTTRPDQIKQLRQTILNLAVRGKLVGQDARDQPASHLLKEIAKARKRLYAEKKIPKPKELPSIEEMEFPFPLPSGWSWSQLGDLCYQVSDGPHFSPRYVAPEDGVPFLSTRNVRASGFDLNALKYVSRTDHEEFCKRIRPEQGDIIYTKGGTTGIAKVNDLDFDFSVWVHLAVLRVEKVILFPKYVEMALNSPHCYAQSQKYTQGTSNFDLGLTRMIKITIPLPPLDEQHRIVAKVDELMALCDQLEASLAEGERARSHLLESVLHHALEPA